jgi:hypothetical protein
MHHPSILSAVTNLCRTILENDGLRIAPEHSLTLDLGFDSMHLMQFFAGIEDLYPSLSLEAWFLEHAGGARDTVGSVVGYMARGMRSAPLMEAA